MTLISLDVFIPSLILAFAVGLIVGCVVRNKYD